jgi:hypothetical protein
MVLQHYPHNKGFFSKLLVFFKEILDICNDLDISPILVGSLAVFAYTKNPMIDVNDIDLAVGESEYARITKISEGKNIEYKIRNYRVLQAKRGDLKIELDSIEYWFKDIPLDSETLQIDEYKIQILSLPSLTKFYAQGMEDRLKKSADAIEKSKYEALKAKHSLLTSL